ncbi:uncharacterized protein LOC141554571 [Sminthopsis crassicaudata]|uniref:uncharacterized protein LOC141554571 n=1 Tax=Sminthopsis crassicaudata TaxID=9301 RepID=UPI003D68127F
MRIVLQIPRTLSNDPSSESVCQAGLQTQAAETWSESKETISKHGISNEEFFLERFILDDPKNSQRQDWECNVKSEKQQGNQKSHSGQIVVHTKTSDMARNHDFNKFQESFSLESIFSTQEIDIIGKKFHKSDKHKVILNEYSDILKQMPSRKAPQNNGSEEALCQTSNFIPCNNMETEKKPYNYNECGKAFSQNTYYIQYQRNHTSEKLNKCIECDKAFSRTSENSSCRETL